MTSKPPQIITRLIRVFGILLFSRKKEYLKDKTFFLFLILLGISRFTVDTYRYFENSIIVYQNGFTISSNQVISILMIITGLFFILFHSSAAYAHKVYLFAWTEGDIIHTESYISGNKKVKDGVIRVFDLEGKELLNGKTNEKGEFFFKIPEITDLRIVLESSMGHGAEYLFKESEFSSEGVAGEDRNIDPMDFA